MTAPLLSVVCPVFNEEDGLEELYTRVTAAVGAIAPTLRHELVFVNDGSTDESLEVLRKLAETDARVRVLDLSRNFGHQAAITAGMDAALGDAVVVIDADLQDPPEVIGVMVGKWLAGDKVVYGVRRQRAGESRFKRVTAKAFYRLLNRLSDMPLPLDTGDFRLLDRQVVDVMCALREENRYIRGLVSWVGFRQSAVEYDRDPRYAGETKYTLRRMLNFATDGITSFSERPLRLSTGLGAITTVLTLLVGLWIVVGKLISPEQSVPGFASLMVVILFLGGVQLLTIGMLGEYVGRIYKESKRRPLYIVAERIGARDDDPDA